MHDLVRYDVGELPNSSFNILLGSRRSGKTVLTEQIIRDMRKAKKLDMVFLFSPTGSGLDFIDESCRFTDIAPLHNIIKNYNHMNDFNKKMKNKKDKFTTRTAVIIDDMASDMKGKDMQQLLTNLAIKGRHSAYAPLSLHFFILSQSLTMIPRGVRLNVDTIIFNNISSAVEKAKIFDEFLYILDSTREGKKRAQVLYDTVISSQPFQFMVCACYKSNVQDFTDFLFTMRGEPATWKKSI